MHVPNHPGIKPLLQLINVGASGAKSDQNKKYRCAIGKTLAGSQVRCTPSAFTV